MSYYDDAGYDSPYHPYRRPQPAASLVGSIVLLLVLVGVVLGLVVWWLWPQVGNAVNSKADLRPVTPAGNLSEEEKATIEIFRKVSPSVVHITSLAAHRSLFTRNVVQVPEGTGSGFIWDTDGHIVTNFHVIRNATGAQVDLADGSSYRASLVGVRADKDLAVLHIRAPKSKLQPISVGSSHDLQVGQFAFAIGNPFGLDHTFTRGLVSALGREITSVTQDLIKDVIQTDAAINPGNSGGPLLDSSARLIGVNTAIYSPSGTSSGIGFAIPVDTVNEVVTQLIRRGQQEEDR
jgi:S1-C subfamily serine protease